MGTAALHMVRMNTSNKSYGKTIGKSHEYDKPANSKTVGKHDPYWRDTEEKVDKKPKKPDWVIEQEQKINANHYLCWDEQIWSGDDGNTMYPNDWREELHQEELDSLMDQCMYLTFDLPIYNTDYRSIVSFNSICKILMRNDYYFDKAVICNDEYYKRAKMMLYTDDLVIPIINLHNRKYNLYRIIMSSRTCCAGTPAAEELSKILPMFENL